MLLLFSLTMPWLPCASSLASWAALAASPALRATSCTVALTSFMAVATWLISSCCRSTA